MMIVGMAGVGKTTLKHLIFDTIAPEQRTSTSVAETPVRAQIRDISGVRVQTGKTNWKKIETACDLEPIVLKTISLIGYRLEEAPDTMAEHQQHRLAAVAKFFRHYWNRITHIAIPARTIPEILDEPEVGTEVDLPDVGSLLNPEVKQHIKSLHARIMEITERNRRGNSHSATQDASKILGSNWVYFIDSGGQPHFHNLLPHFVQGISVILFTYRLSDKLDDYAVVEYYENGESIGAPYKSPITTRDTLRYLMHSVHSDNTDGERPRIILIGTFLDKIEESGETLADKNAQLTDFIPTKYKDHILLHGINIDKPILAINAKSPSAADDEAIQSIRSEIESYGAHKDNIPIAWYVLEILLENLASKVNRKILRKIECLEIARILNFENPEKELVSALEFFHSKHLFHFFPNILPDVVFTDPQVLLDKVTELVKHSYQLRESASTKSYTGAWHAFRDRGIITLTILKKFETHYEDGLFCASDLLKILEQLLIITPFTMNEKILIDFTSPTVEFLMPSLLDALPPSDLEKYREQFTSLEPLVLVFPECGSLRLGVFCCVQVFLIKNLKWELLHTDNKPEIIAQNCVMMTHSKLACDIIIIDSLSYLEIYVDPKLGNFSGVCQQIKCDVFEAVRVANLALNYQNAAEGPDQTFFCHCRDQQAALDSKTDSPLVTGTTQQRHIGKVKEKQLLQCSINQMVYTDLTSKHEPWLEPGEHNLYCKCYCICP